MMMMMMMIKPTPKGQHRTTYFSTAVPEQSGTKYRPMLLL